MIPAHYCAQERFAAAARRAADHRAADRGASLLRRGGVITGGEREIEPSIHVREQRRRRCAIKHILDMRQPISAEPFR